ncbi:exosortase/archaeosortase family protein [Botrimarina mediterranea]|uniref:Transmembrane exosortase (Exosortase_EpsH) n=1 Tax=Botrimarina mediterranea TaxID=2528022 RepID=A0A518K3L4_9BACT|nr:exosortase/archaeosortase family protein [Botrimarina mediterranea]QDV72369.1 Transmembrane exosortase (Exosortase_EpsH) [Botrimarina mediterranea]QDV76915.1 Transmembrane exosortase (Exosortase_EpsH) [Planctomycetes bacterium K2D]
MAHEFVSPVSPFAGGAAPSAERFSWSDSYQKHSYLGLLGLTALLTYSYWNMLENTSAFWQSDQYSHGWIVPLIALYLMWTMRPNPVAQDPPEGVAEETFLGLMPASLFGQVAAGVGAATTAGGLALGNPLMQGVGIAIVCMAGLAYVLIGQPFDRVAAGERWIGLAVLLIAYALRIFLGANLYMEPVNRLSFLLALFGGFMMIGGWSLLRWTGAAIGFLIFMYPLPSVIEHTLLLGLQKLAAIASEVVLTILSQPVVREGSVISVDGLPLAVAEACSGLRMVTIFGGFAVACALLIKRPWWDKLIVLLSAIPIALIVNVARIVTIALLFRVFPEGEAIHTVIHDYAGLAMMPLAMGLMYIELKLLSLLSVEDESIDSGHGAASAFGVGVPTSAR